MINGTDGSSTEKYGIARGRVIENTYVKRFKATLPASSTEMFIAFNVLKLFSEQLVLEIKCESLIQQDIHALEIPQSHWIFV